MSTSAASEIVTIRNRGRAPRSYTTVHKKIKADGTPDERAGSFTLELGEIGDKGLSEKQRGGRPSPTAKIEKWAFLRLKESPTFNYDLKTEKIDAVTEIH